jgi:hypothetical protein
LLIAFLFVEDCIKIDSLGTHIADSKEALA